MTEYKIGDKLRRVSPTSLYFTKGCVYDINDIRDLTMYVHDDFNDEHGMGAKFASERFELVVEPSEHTPVEASPTVIALLANISRRLYEAEQTIKEQAYEINELYRSLAEQEVADRG